MTVGSLHIYLQTHLRVITVTSTGKGGGSGPYNSPMDDTYGQACTQRRGRWAAVLPPSKQKLKKKEFSDTGQTFYKITLQLKSATEIAFCPVCLNF